jgi:SAM-dependent methyltransferase
MSTRAADGYEAIADLYDHVIPYRDRPDVAFYVSAAQGSGGPVLEIGCGTGRVLVPTARAGVEVTGLDASPHMLRVCGNRLRQESAEVRARVRLVRADMRDFTLPCAYSLITLPFRPFQHMITVDDQLSCLSSIRKHLVDGGRVVLDLFNPSLDALANRKEGEEYADEPEFTTPDGRRVTRRHRIVAHDRFNQVNRVELLYYVTHPDGREERLVHAFAMRYLFRFEAEHLLARGGFEVEHVYADYDGSAYGSRYPGDLIIVARKSSRPLP